MSAGTSNGGDVQPSFSRAPATSSGAERRAVRLRRCPPWCGAPKPIIGPAGDQARAIAMSAPPSIAARDRRRGHGRRPGRRSSRRPRSARPGRPSSRSDGGPSIEMPLSSNSTIRRAEPEMAGERDRLLADALHQVAVAGDHVGAMVDDVVAELGRSAAARRSPCRPRWRAPARAGRWSSRCPARGRISGWPARRRAELAEALDLARSSSPRSRSDRAARRAASSRGRPTARSGRGPASAAAAGSNFRKRVNSTVATSAMPIGRPGWPDFACSTASIASARMALARRPWATREAADGLEITKNGTPCRK